MQYPEIGSKVDVVIDNSFVYSYLAADSKHRAKPQDVIRGTVFPAPTWASDHLCVINSDTKARNLIPPHRIISINNTVVRHKPVVKDVLLTVQSSKTGESYNVRMDGRTKKWSCTCTGFQFHKKCRHAVRAQQQYEAGEI